MKTTSRDFLILSGKFESLPVHTDKRIIQHLELSPFSGDVHQLLSNRLLAMPVYTYRCENCGVQFDQKQKFTDNPLVTCPECGKKSLRKVYQPVGIVFKGSGFYATDHKSPSGGLTSAGKEEKPPSSDTTTSAATASADSTAKPTTEKKEASSTPAPATK